MVAKRGSQILYDGFSYKDGEGGGNSARRVRGGEVPPRRKNPQTVFDTLPCERAIIYTMLGYISLNATKTAV